MPPGSHILFSSGSGVALPSNEEIEDSDGFFHSRFAFLRMEESKVAPGGGFNSADDAAALVALGAWSSRASTTTAMM